MTDTIITKAARFIFKDEDDITLRSVALDYAPDRFVECGLGPDSAARRTIARISGA